MLYQGVQSAHRRVRDAPVPYQQKSRIPNSPDPWKQQSNPDATPLHGDGGSGSKPAPLLPINHDGSSPWQRSPVLAGLSETMRDGIEPVWPQSHRSLCQNVVLRSCGLLFKNIFYLSTNSRMVTAGKMLWPCPRLWEMHLSQYPKKSYKA